MNKDDDKESFYAFISIIVLMALISMTVSCSNVTTALEIPQHIQQRILETENTYMVDVKYLVWNDMLESYEWEYYSDFNYDL
jgi:hypothetical protein